MLTLHINGQSRTFELPETITLDQVLNHLELKADRIAVEHNGEIVPKTIWATTNLTPNDRLEIVHFVGGGAG